MHSRKVGQGNAFDSVVSWQQGMADSLIAVLSFYTRSVLWYTSLGYSLFLSLRREKKENAQILQQQLDQYREQASSLRLDNAKIAAKVSE